MPKPDFSQLTRKELKAYIRQHPTDDEAIRELFVNRRHPDAKVYPFPYNMTKEELRTFISYPSKKANAFEENARDVARIGD